MPRDEAIRLAVAAVKDRLEEVGVRWVIFAGAAAYCYGSKRKVTDIDILVKTADFAKAKAAVVGTEGFDVVGDLEIETSQGSCRFFMDEDMIKRIQWKLLFGVRVPVVPVEDNVIFKAILQRGEDQGKHDIEDVQDMIANERMDLNYLEKRIQKYGAERQVKPLLKRLGVL